MFWLVPGFATCIGYALQEFRKIKGICSATLFKFALSSWLATDFG